jgi:drug/metabolite transporter (DMT)-like permease
MIWAGGIMNRLLRGSAIFLFAFTVISFVYLISRFLPNVHVSVKVLFFFGIPTLASLPIMLRQPVLFRGANYALLFGRSVFAVLAYGLTFLVISKLSLVDATLLQNTAPLWIPLVALAWSGERVPLRVVLGLLVGFLGIFLILNPLSGFRFNIWIAAGLASGVFYAIVIHALKVLAGRLHPVTATFYYFLFCTLMVLPFAMANWQPLDLRSLGLLVLAGLGYFVGLESVAYGMLYVSSAVASSFCYVAILWAAIFDWAIWRQVPTIETAVGAVLVIASGISVVIFSRRSHPVEVHGVTNPTPESGNP